MKDHIDIGAYVLMYIKYASIHSTPVLHEMVVTSSLCKEYLTVVAQQMRWAQWMRVCIQISPSPAFSPL